MYINFKFLTSSGLDLHQVMTMIAINQGEEMFYAERTGILKFLCDGGYAEKQKNGRHKLTDKGKAFTEALEKTESSKDVEELTLELYAMYTDRGKPTGNKKEIEDNLAWFCAHTNFSNKAVTDTVSDYLVKAGEYTMSLSNLVWKAPNVFAAHKNLKNSRLFDEVAAKFKINPSFYLLDKKSRAEEWMFAVSRLPQPPVGEGLHISGSRDGDIEGIQLVKKKLFKHMETL